MKRICGSRVVPGWGRAAVFWTGAVFACAAFAQTVPVSKLKSDFLSLYAAGNHPKAAEVALQVPLDSPELDANTRMKMAQSLSWTGHPKQSLSHYQRLLGTNYESVARVAMGNEVRWTGEPDVARRHYIRALALDPSNQEARKSLEQVERDLRPSTKVTVGRSLDSGNMERAGVTVAHSWRDKSSQHIFGIEGSATRSQYETPPLNIPQQDLTARYKYVGTYLRPELYINFQRNPFNGTFGGVSVSPKETPLTLTLERLNWGVAGLSALALSKQMTANRAAISANGSSSWGLGRARIENFQISDGNSIVASSWYFQPAWRPLGQNLKLYGTIETREAKFNTPNYWSPVNGSGTGGLGIIGEWATGDTTLYASAQGNRRIYGDAGNGWSVGAGFKTWVTKDYALGANLWGMKSIRDGAIYRAHSFNLTGEKLW